MNRSMARFALCLVAFLLGAMVALGGEPKIRQLEFYSLAPDTQVVLRTKSRVITLDMVDPAEGEVLIRTSSDGEIFNEPRTAFLLGATKGKQQGALSLVEMGVVRAGLKLELGLGNLLVANRVHTSEITSIELRLNK